MSTVAGAKQRNICYVYILDTLESLEPRPRVKNAIYTDIYEMHFSNVSRANVLAL